MANKRFTCGRYANKTYEDIVKLDPKFCRDAMNYEGDHKYYPEDFKRYCRTVFERGSGDGYQEPIKERNAHYFLYALSQRPHLLQLFRNIIGQPRIHEKIVHDELKSSGTNGFLGVFYRFFVKKCIFRLQKVPGFNQYIEEYAKIFPFKVDPNLRHVDVSVRNVYDDKFVQEISIFLSSHFEDVESEVVIDAFLSNVFCFRRDHFNEAEIEELRNRIDNLKTKSIENQRSDVVIRYLENFPRLNEEGALRYQTFGCVYERAAELHQLAPVNPSKNSSTYWSKLPEVNVYELFSLLETDFYNAERENYVQLFQKYIFFFEHARRSDTKPVFFIDDFLFECLKYLAEFKRSDQPPLELKKALVAVSQVHRRKQGSEGPEDNFKIDNSHLLLVQEYVEKIPHIESSVVEREIKTDALIDFPLLVTKGTLYTMRLSTRKRQYVDNFYKVILTGAFYPGEISRLAIYNAYKGCEYSIEMPRAKEKIRDFVHQHNHFDFSRPLPVEKYLTWGWETCFEANTINWEERAEAADRA